MITEVIMHRGLFDSEIRQKSKSGFFNATDLVRAANVWRRDKGMAPFNLSYFLKEKRTEAFLDALSEKYGTVLEVTRGRDGTTWVHPYLFIDIALALDPQLKIEVYGWLYDYLLKYRNDSGDSYKKMSGSIANAVPNRENFRTVIASVAVKIRTAIGVEDWQHATQEQLELRDKMHNNISLLCDILPIDDAVRIGIAKALT